MQPVGPNSTTFSSSLNSSYVNQFLSLHGVTVARQANDQMANYIPTAYTYPYIPYYPISSYPFGKMHSWLVMPTGNGYVDLPFTLQNSISNSAVFRIPFVLDLVGTPIPADLPFKNPTSTTPGWVPTFNNGVGSGKVSASTAYPGQFTNPIDVYVSVQNDDGTGHPDSSIVYGSSFIPKEQIQAVSNGSWPEPQEVIFGEWDNVISSENNDIYQNQIDLNAGVYAVRCGGINTTFLTSGFQTYNNNFFSNRFQHALFSNRKLYPFVEATTLPSAVGDTTSSTTIVPSNVTYSSSQECFFVCGQTGGSNTSTFSQGVTVTSNATFPSSGAPITISVSSTTNFSANGGTFQTNIVPQSGIATIAYTGVGSSTTLTGCYVVSYPNFSYTLYSGSSINGITSSSAATYIASFNQNGQMGAWIKQTDLPITTSSSLFPVNVTLSDGSEWVIVFDGTTSNSSAYASQLSNSQVSYWIQLPSINFYYNYSPAGYRNTILVFPGTSKLYCQNQTVEVGISNIISSTGYNVLNVASTNGFPNSGSFYLFQNSTQYTITYNGLNSTQFLECTVAYSVPTITSTSSDTVTSIDGTLSAAVTTATPYFYNQTSFNIPSTVYGNPIEGIIGNNFVVSNYGGYVDNGTYLFPLAVVAADSTWSNTSVNPFYQQGQTYKNGSVFLTQTLFWSFYNNDGTYSVFTNIFLQDGATYAPQVISSSVTAYQVNWLNVPVPLSSTLASDTKYHLVINTKTGNQSTGISFPVTREKLISTTINSTNTNTISNLVPSSIYVQDLLNFYNHFSYNSAGVFYITHGGVTYTMSCQGLGSYTVLTSSAALSSNSRSASTVNVTSTTGFPSSGTFLFTIGSQYITNYSVTYTGKTSTSFTNCIINSTTPVGPITVPISSGGYYSRIIPPVINCVITSPSSSSQSISSLTLSQGDSVFYPSIAYSQVASYSSTATTGSWNSINSSLLNPYIPFQVWGNGNGYPVALVEPSTDTRTSYLYYGYNTGQLIAAGEWSNNLRSFFTMNYDPATGQLASVNEIDNLEED